MAKTSIHIQPAKSGSEEHNKRLKELDYVRKDLTHLNQYWESDTQSARLDAIKELVKTKTGRALQAKATPIREAVVVIKPDTTMDDLRKLAYVYKEKFGIEVFQIAIHKDEGHSAAKDWTANLHAHLVFDWTNHETGKSVKLNRDQMATMQTITADVLGMERGNSSDKKHLSAIQYKIEARTKQLEELERSVGTGAKILSWFGVGQLADIRRELEEANKEIERLKDANQKVREDAKKRISEANKQIEGLKRMADSNREVLEQEKQIKANLVREICVLEEKLEKLRPTSEEQHNQERTLRR